MNLLQRAAMAALVFLLCAPGASHAQPATNLQLRLEPRTNAIDLVVDGDAASGAFFIYQANNLESLLTSPTVAVQTNTPLTNGLRFSLPATGQAFFTAAHWPGRAIEEFGEPEDYPDIPPPAMVLFTSGAPVPLAGGQSFTVDFFITDPAGQLLDVSGPVAILVFRESDGALHPDATLSPPTAQLTNGHLRLTVTIQSIASLDGYTLGLGPDTGGLAGFLEGLFFPASSGLSQSIRPSFNVAPATLEQLRTDNADPGPSWSYPLAVTGHSVSGTFGEWRGKDNKDVHRGVDLAAVAASTVVASRGGVVLFRGTLPGEPMGDYVVIDHGNGWFSRYLHLDQSSILASVRQGEPVARGATLATSLFVRSDAQVATNGRWGVHLHFEIRKATSPSVLGYDKPGLAQDPLQTPSIFDVPPGGTLPDLREFGLTRQHLGQNAFAKGPPTADAPGPVYLFAKFLDPEPKPDGTERKLALRALRFQPEGALMPVEIRPANDTAIAAFLPPAAGAVKGFALYAGAHAALPDPANYFRYWWRWDTSGYANDRRGPRSLGLIGEDHAPSTAGFPFTFGPQIKSNSLTQITPQQYQFTNVAYLGTNTPLALGNAALYVQPDQYKLEIIRPTGQPLGGVVWSGPMAGNYTRVFTTHLDEAVYTFTLPAGATTEALKLRVSSRLAPDIGHEVCLCGGPDMAFIPAGPFVMGSDEYPGSCEHPTHTVQVSAFCMDKHEVTKARWDDVYNWAITCGYSFGFDAQGKAANHPAHSMTWYDAVKWCNARSEKEGRTPAYYTDAAQTAVYRGGQVNVQNGWVKWGAGYRLPTEAEREKAARGGLSGRRFPWGDTISHAQANYYGFPASSGGYAYDLAPVGYHPTYATSPTPYTSPVGSFAANGYGLHDMAGNVWEWCSDWWNSTYYSSSPGTDPRGPASGSYRVIRGGSWNNVALRCRSAIRDNYYPDYGYDRFGFRSVLPPGQP